MRDDIYGGLKNALERGATIQQAIESFVRAGYPRNEVLEAANQITGGVLDTMNLPENQNPTQNLPKQPQQPTQRQSQAFRPMQQKPQSQVQASLMQTSSYKPLSSEGSRLVKHSNTGMIIFLSFILLILLGALGSTIIFRVEITDFLTNLF